MNAFTVDFEDWYQGIELPMHAWGNYIPRLEIGANRILNLLEKYQTKATFFVLGWIGDKYPNLIKDIASRGHEIGSHGYSHEKIYNLTREQFREEIRRTKKNLEDLTGNQTSSFRAPFFTVTPKTLWALDILSEEGYEIDCSISPVKTWRYGIADTPREVYRIAPSGITEFPVSTFRFLTTDWGIGGAYFRIFPYTLTRKSFRLAENDNRPLMFYIHPWEYDPEHPRIKFERKAMLTHYRNLHRTLPLTAKLLAEFKFTTVSDVVHAYQKSHALRTITADVLEN